MILVDGTANVYFAIALTAAVRPDLRSIEVQERAQLGGLRG